MARLISLGLLSQRAVDPTTSENRKVIVPDGRAPPPSRSRSWAATAGGTYWVSTSPIRRRAPASPT